MVGHRLGIFGKEGALPGWGAISAHKGALETVVSHVVDPSCFLVVLCLRCEVLQNVLWFWPVMWSEEALFFILSLIEFLNSCKGRWCGARGLAVQRSIHRWAAGVGCVAVLLIKKGIHPLTPCCEASALMGLLGSVTLKELV